MLFIAPQPYLISYYPFPGLPTQTLSMLSTSIALIPQPSEVALLVLYKYEMFDMAYNPLKWF